MYSQYYVLAAVLGGALVAAEAALGKTRRVRAYGFADTVNNISHFLGELSLTALLHLNVFAGYALLSERIAVVRLPEASWATWAFALVLLDGVYYWGHRLCHRVGALWALHAVHHQSGELNYSVGLRGPWLSALQIAPFLVPLALIGIPTQVLFPLYAFHTIWKLLVHTRLIGKLGPLEAVLVTPSQHRVHHATNAHYLDKNFGGLFSVWDRLFGTYQAEDEAPRFAPAPALHTLDPLANNVAPWRELAAHARGAGWLRALFGRPAAPAAAAAATAAPEAEGPAGGARAWAAAQLGGAAVVTLSVLAFGAELPAVVRWPAGAAGLVAIVALGRRLRAGEGAAQGPVAGAAAWAERAA